MATRTLTWTQWLKLLTRHISDDQYPLLNGLPTAEVASRLDVTLQRVFQLIDDGTFDTIRITTGAGRVALILVTEQSFESYLERRVTDRNRVGCYTVPAR